MITITITILLKIRNLLGSVLGFYIYFLTWIYFLLVQQLEATAAKDARCGNADKTEKERESHRQSGFELRHWTFSAIFKYETADDIQVTISQIPL